MTLSIQECQPVRIAELSETTGISVPTLKFYLREGLLHSGTATAVNQASYDTSHVRRVKLVRALIELGRLSLADVRRVVDTADDESTPIHDAFGIAQDAMASGNPRDTPEYANALEEVEGFIQRHGLHIRPQAGVRNMLADAMLSLSDFGWCPPGQVDSVLFDSLVPTALENAAFELLLVPENESRSVQMEFTVVGTIAFDLAASAIRRMALEHARAMSAFARQSNGRRSQPIPHGVQRPPNRPANRPRRSSPSSRQPCMGDPIVVSSTRWRVASAEVRYRPGPRIPWPLPGRCPSP